MRPLKRTGWGHGVYETSNSKREIVGTYRPTQDNRGFRYVYNTSAIGAGKAMSSVAEANANLLNQASDVIHAIGETSISFNPGASVTLTEDELEGGFYIVNDGTGEGQMRRIVGNQAISADASFKITIDAPLKVATAATSATEHSIILNPWNKVVIWATADFFPVGVPQVALPALEYGWNQTHGWGVAWTNTNTAAGTELVHSTTGGQLAIQDGYLLQTIGYLGPCIGIAGDYYPVFFCID